MEQNEVGKMGWKLRANTTVAKIRKAEVKNGVAHYDQKVLTGDPQLVRSTINEGLPGAKVDVEMAHNIKVWDQEEIQPITNGVMKTYRVAVVQEDTVGDQGAVQPLETYDNTSRSSCGSECSPDAGNQVDTEKPPVPLSKGEYFLKNMVDKLYDWRTSHENEHTEKDIATGHKDTAKWLAIIGVAIMAATALAKSLMG